MSRTREDERTLELYGRDLTPDEQKIAKRLAGELCRAYKAGEKGDLFYCSGDGLVMDLARLVKRDTL